MRRFESPSFISLLRSPQPLFYNEVFLKLLKVIQKQYFPLAENNISEANHYTQYKTRRLTRLQTMYNVLKFNKKMMK